MNHATVLTLAEQHQERLLAAALLKEKTKLPPYLQPAKPKTFWEEFSFDNDTFFLGEHRRFR